MKLLLDTHVLLWYITDAQVLEALGELSKEGT